MDPITGFLYPYQNYDQIPQNNFNALYNVKPEPYNQNAVPNIQNHQPPPYTNDQLFPSDVKDNSNVIEATVKENVVPTPQQLDSKHTEDVDTKEPLKHLLPQKRRRNGPKKGRTSSYWVKKIDDKQFPFFGCAICNVSYTTIKELDDHVKVHEGRLTSYDIRLHYQKMKREKRKEEKRLKKLIKSGVVKEEDVKKEKKKMRIENKDNFVDIDIKPEDGYIGNEKASDYNDIEATDQPTEKKVVTKYGETTDPRLHKLYKCYACQKQFSLCYYLKLHVRAHTNEKPYICTKCGQSFITAGHLGRHNKRIHLAVRFQCRICFKFFARFDNLQRHFDKKHLDQKLEGEPYDYNAILPYLQEIEESNSMEKDAKPKKEDNWADAKPENEQTCDYNSQLPSRKDNDVKNYVSNFEPKLNADEGGHIIFGDNPYIFKQEDESEELHPLNQFEAVVVEAMPPPVKEEADDPKEYPAEYLDEGGGGSGGAGSGGGGDNLSDEDYFPENTWVEVPKVEKEEEESIKRKTIKKGTKDSYCEICEKSYTASYYKTHMRTHTGEKPFKCVICDRRFISSYKLQEHVVTHNHWKERIKDLESKDIKDEMQDAADELLEDMKETHIKEESDDTAPKKTKKKKKGKKSKILKEKSNKGYKNKIVKKEKPGKGYKRHLRCPFCYKTFMYENAFEVHRVSHKDATIPLPCYFCMDAHPTEDSLKQHEAAHSDNPKFLCTLCDKRFYKREVLIAHRKNVHNDESATKTFNPTRSKKPGRPKSQFICDICSKACYTLKSLQKHIVGHAQEKYSLRYECPVCAHMFHTKYHAQMHLVTHQKEGLILEENRADILAMVMQNARKIPRKAEEPVTSELLPPDDRSRVCNICGQIFQHFFYLEQHLKTHGSKIAVEDITKEEERKHVCKVCNKGFKLPYYLKLHSFTHIKERPYICQQCGKGFITKGKLKRHLETHSGLKKHQCHICYKFFTRPAYLRIHVRTIHGTQDYNFTLALNKMPAENGL